MGDVDNNRWLKTQLYYFRHLYFLTRYREEVFLCFSIGSFPLQTVIGTRLFDQVCHQRLCQCILICVSIHFVSQATRMSMHLTLKIYTTSFSQFQVMTFTHHHTKEILIFKHHIDVPTKTIWTNKQRRIEINVFTTAGIVHPEGCIDICQCILDSYPWDSKVHGANMGPTWVLLAQDGPHVGPMSLAIRDVSAFHHRMPCVPIDFPVYHTIDIYRV